MKNNIIQATVKVYFPEVATDHFFLDFQRQHDSFVKTLRQELLNELIVGYSNQKPQMKQLPIASLVLGKYPSDFKVKFETCSFEVTGKITTTVEASLNIAKVMAQVVGEKVIQAIVDTLYDCGVEGKSEGSNDYHVALGITLVADKAIIATITLIDSVAYEVISKTRWPLDKMANFVKVKQDAWNYLLQQGLDRREIVDWMLID